MRVRPPQSPGRFSSPTTKTEVKNKVCSAPSITQPGFGFLCVFVSLRESFAPLARPQRAMLRSRYRVVLLNCFGPPSPEGDTLLPKILQLQVPFHISILTVLGASRPVMRQLAIRGGFAIHRSACALPLAPHRSACALPLTLVPYHWA